MEAAIDICGAFSTEKVFWYLYRLIFSGVISVGHGQSLGIFVVRACLIVCDAILGLCVDSAVRQVRIDLLGVIRIVFIEAIRNLLLVWSFSMEVSVHVFVLKDVGSLIVRSIIER